MLSVMKKARITTGGQVSLPADVRRRWNTRVVAVEDLGDRVVLRPLPDDPVSAARGALTGRLPTTAELRAAARRDEAAAERR
jgi:bifunctional DNA-binding transcriptional regulator/antitoxin component of YhaV-PrlF toxin-antitoxin module